MNELNFLKRHLKYILKKIYAYLYMNRESVIMLVYLSLIFKAKKLSGSQLQRFIKKKKKRNY